MTPRGIFGLGAIGGLLAARVSKAGHDVTVIATERTAVAIELAGPIRIVRLTPCASA